MVILGALWPEEGTLVVALPPPSGELAKNVPDTVVSVSVVCFSVVSTVITSPMVAAIVLV